MVSEEKFNEIKKAVLEAKDVNELLKCWTCGKKMKSVKDSITGTITGHVWAYDCKCNPSTRRVLIG